MRVNFRSAKISPVTILAPCMVLAPAMACHCAGYIHVISLALTYAGCSVSFNITGFHTLTAAIFFFHLIENLCTCSPGSVHRRPALTEKQLKTRGEYGHSLSVTRKSTCALHMVQVVSNCTVRLRRNKIWRQWASTAMFTLLACPPAIMQISSDNIKIYMKWAH